MFDSDMDLRKPVDIKTRLYCSKRCADADVREGHDWEDPKWEGVAGCYEETVDRVIGLLTKHLKDATDLEKAEELRKRLKGNV